MLRLCATAIVGRMTTRLPQPCPRIADTTTDKDAPPSSFDGWATMQPPPCSFVTNKSSVVNCTIIEAVDQQS